MAKGGERVVFWIGVFKLAKATLLTALGVIGVIGMKLRLAHLVGKAIGWVGAFPGRHLLSRALGRLMALDPHATRLLGILCLGYASVFLVEGIGLLRGKRWAEWLTVFVTASFVPIEIYELVGHFRPGGVAALLLNVGIVIYLVLRRLRERRRPLGRDLFGGGMATV